MTITADFTAPASMTTAGTGRTRTAITGRRFIRVVITVVITAAATALPSTASTRVNVPLTGDRRVEVTCARRVEACRVVVDGHRAVVADREVVVDPAVAVGADKGLQPREHLVWRA
jgi:hypothetical protein